MSERGRRRRRGKRKKYMQVVKEMEAKMRGHTFNANRDRFPSAVSELVAAQIRETLRKESLVRKIFPVVHGTVTLDEEEE